MFLKSFLSALHRGNHTYYVLGWTVLTGLFSHRAPSSSCRLLPACPEEVRCCHSCSSEPRPDVGGDSGESRQRAVGFGSSPPGCLRSASEVKPSPHLQSFNMKMYCFALSSCRQRSVVVIKLLSTDTMFLNIPLFPWIKKKSSGQTGYILLRQCKILMLT